MTQVLEAPTAIELRIVEKDVWGEENTRHEVWLVIDGTPVAWATTSYMPSYEQYQCLDDIEVRDGYTGLGYARQIISLIVEEFGKPIAVSGGFTPEGFAAFSGKFPILPGYDYDVPTGPKYRSMKFVNDWDNFYGCR